MTPNLTTLEIVLVAISKNSNSFGLHGHMVMARDGRTWQAAANRSPGTGLLGSTARGGLIVVRAHGGEPQWAEMGAEIPKAMPIAPPGAVREAFAPYVSAGYPLPAEAPEQKKELLADAKPGKVTVTFGSKDDSITFQLIKRALDKHGNTLDRLDIVDLVDILLRATIK